MDPVALVLAIFDRIARPIARLWSHPELTIELVGHAGTHMVDLAQNYVNVSLTIRNTGRGPAKSYRAEARVERVDTVSLELVDSREPGNATCRADDGDDVVEWQSSEEWPVGHTRTIACRLRMSRDRHVRIAVTLIAPLMRPVHQRVDVSWLDGMAVIELVAPD